MAVDFSEFEKFKEKLKGIEKELPEFFEGCANEIGARLLRATKQKTPVGIYPAESGKTGGTLRRNWNVTEVKHTLSGYTLNVINNTEYASYVEYGHRQNVGQFIPALGKKLKKPWVEGRHMLTDSVNELKPKVDGITEKRLNTWLEEKLK